LVLKIIIFDAMRSNAVGVFSSLFRGHAARQRTFLKKVLQKECLWHILTFGSEIRIDASVDTRLAAWGACKHAPGQS
jgi:hypothetical protein